MRILFSFFIPLFLFSSNISIFSSIDEEEKELGLYADRSFFIDESELFMGAFFKTKGDKEIRELYYQIYMNDYKLNIGRKIEYFGVGNTHNLLNFLGNSKESSNREDREYKNIGADGIEISKEFYEESLVVNLYLKERENVQYKLIKIEKSFDSALLDLYFSNIEKQDSIGANFDIEFLEEYIFYLEVKEKKELDSLIGIKYTPSSEYSFFIEGIYQKSGEDKQERIQSLINLKQEDKENYFSSLQSKKYINFGTIYREDDITLLSFFYKNLVDNSRRLVLQGEYVYNNFKFTLRHINNSGEKFAEFADSLDDSNYFFVGFNKNF